VDVEVKGKQKQQQQQQQQQASFKVASRLGLEAGNLGALAGDAVAGNSYHGLWASATTTRRERLINFHTRSIEA
jgi:hypothetical protein